MRSRRRRERVEHIPYKAMWQALDWAVEHGCHTVAGLNEIIRGGRLPELIRAADELYERTLEQIAAAILERRDELRFIIVAGPSSSGKTTTTHKLAEHLEAAGLDGRAAGAGQLLLRSGAPSPRTSSATTTSRRRRRSTSS